MSHTLYQISAHLMELFASKKCPRSKIAPKKSEMCESWLAGEPCSFHPNCHYAHGMEEIYPRTFDKSIYKTRACTNMVDCRYKTRCCYCHDDICYVVNEKLKVLHSTKENVYRVIIDSTPTTVSVLTFHQVESLQMDPMSMKYTRLFEQLKTLVPAVKAGTAGNYNGERNTRVLNVDPKPNKVQYHENGHTSAPLRMVSEIQTIKENLENLQRAYAHQITQLSNAFKAHQNNLQHVGNPVFLSNSPTPPPVPNGSGLLWPTPNSVFHNNGNWKHVNYYGNNQPRTADYRRESNVNSNLNSGFIHFPSYLQSPFICPHQRNPHPPQQSTNQPQHPFI
eukprot:UN30949